MPLSHSPPRILLVDDDCEIRKTLGELLASERYEPVLAASAGEALTTLASQRVDLVLSDLMMPETSGAELLRLLALDPRYRRIPTILITAADPDMAADAIAEAGVETVVLRKPIEIPELLALLRRRLDGPAVSAGARASRESAGPDIAARRPGRAG